MAKALLLLCLTICQANSLFGNAVDPRADDEPSYRLPTDVVPSSYILNLEPNLNNFTFTGNVAITIEVKTDVKSIILNQKNLKINKVELKNSKMGIEVKEPELVEKQELLIIRPQKENIGNGIYTLTINYSGELNDQKRGFYRSRYIDENKYIK